MVGSALGNYIYLTHATILESINELMHQRAEPEPGHVEVIKKLSGVADRNIAGEWLKEFFGAMSV